MDYIVSVPACFPHTWDRRPSSLHVEFFHSGSSIFTGFLYPKISPVASHWMWFYVGSTVIVYIFWVYVRMLVWSSVKFNFSVGFIRNCLGAFLNVVTWLTLLVLDMVLYLCVLSHSTLVPVFGFFPPLMGYHGAVLLVYPI